MAALKTCTMHNELYNLLGKYLAEEFNLSPVNTSEVQ